MNLVDLSVDTSDILERWFRWNPTARPSTDWYMCDEHTNCVNEWGNHICAARYEFIMETVDVFEAWDYSGGPPRSRCYNPDICDADHTAD